MRLIVVLAVTFIFVSDSYGQSALERFEDLYSSAIELRNNYEYDASIETFKGSLQLAENELGSNEIYRSGIYLAVTYLWYAKASEARDLLRALIENHFESFSNYQKGWITNRLAWSLIETGYYEEAITEYESAFSYGELANDHELIFSSLRSKSVAEQYLSRYDDAIETLKTVRNLESLDSVDVALINVGLYTAHSFKSEFANGYPYLLAAYEVFKKQKNSGRYKDILHRFSEYHMVQNELRKALQFAQEGLIISQETNDPDSEALFNFTLGHIYRDLGQNKLAIEYYDASADYYGNIGNSKPHEESELLIISLLIADGEYELARNVLDELILRVKLPESRLRLKLQYASLYQKMGDFEKSKEYIEQAETELDTIVSLYRAKIIEAYLNLPDSLLSVSNKIELAKELYELKSGNTEKGTMLAEMKLSKLFNKVSADSAFSYAYSSIAKLEDRRLNTSSSSVKSIANSQWQGFYYTVAGWEVVYNEDYDQGFLLFEKAKSRTLFEQIYEHQKLELMDVENPNSMKLMELQKRIDQKYNDQNNDLASDAELLEIAQLELEYTTTFDDLTESNPEWSNLEYPTVTTLGEAQELLDRDDAILSYGVTDEGLYLYMVFEDDVQFYSNHSVSISDLTQLVNNYLEAIINQENENELEVHSTELTKFLIDPVSNELEEIKNLIIIPDGPLHLLPFEALINKNEYLIQRFSIKYLPSISVYTILNKTNPGDFDDKFLGIAGSGFESGDDIRGSSTQNDFSTLPYAIAEVDSIATNFSDPLLLKNEQVTEAAFKQLPLNRYEIIHMATHGEINEFAPDQSGLILSKKRNTETLFGEDGFLNAREISQLDIEANLVVLSACNTGTGKVINGEGVMGLQRSLFISGASSVVVSLWSIFDRSTPVFMNKFYNQMNSFEEEEISLLDKLKMAANWYEPDLVDYKTLALQQTKIEMIEHPYYSHPVHWAPFVITGK